MSVYKIEYQISFENSPALCGTAEAAPGEFHLRLELPEDKIVCAQALLRLDTAAEEKVFINGYQTWTLCPEYGPEDFIPGARHLPKPIVDYFGIDRYGDYHFVDYCHYSSRVSGSCSSRSGRPERWLPYANPERSIWSWFRNCRSDDQGCVASWEPPPRRATVDWLRAHSLRPTAPAPKR